MKKTCDRKSKIRSKGKGRGLGVGKGKGPRGVPYKKKKERRMSNKNLISFKSFFRALRYACGLIFKLFKDEYIKN